MENMSFRKNYVDQSFSYENFREILDEENRKGSNFEKEFFPDVFLISQKISVVNKKFQKGKKEENQILFEERDKEKENKEILLKTKLNVFSKEINDTSFNFDVVQKGDVYTLNYFAKTSCFFAIKQLQKNFRTVYKIKQANRNCIISQLTQLLNDNFPKTILKLDIKHFYESIPQDKLLEKINADNLLSPLSKKLITSLITEYNTFTGQSIGVPRGIGISAYLSEFYLRDIDNEIKTTKNLVYYARYVDDIFLIYNSLDNADKIYDKINDIFTLLSKINS